MKQKIELYGRLREVASTQTVELSVDTPCTIAEASTALVREYPALADTVQGDETLVLLPPVSGG